MDIVVCVKQVPDAGEAKIDSGTKAMIREGVSSVVSAFDKNALEAAVQLKEAHGGKVTVITMGPENAKAALKECISVGADRAVLVSDQAFAQSDTLATSYILAEAIKTLGKFDIILCGRQSIDSETAAVGPQLAERLDMPQVTFVSKLEANGDQLTAQRETAEGYEVVETKIPVLCSVTKSINEPRFPTIKSKLAANKANIELLTLADLPNLNKTKIGLEGSQLRVARVFLPVKRESGVKIQEKTDHDSALKLLALISEAKVI